MNEPAATSYWQRIATYVREGFAGVRGACAVTRTAQQYTRVIPVLAGQVRAAASRADELTESSRETLRRLHDRGADNARRAVEAAARIEDAICALKVMSLHLDQGTQIESIRGLAADLERSLTTAMTAVRDGAEAEATHLHAAAREAEQLAQDRASQRLQHVIDTLSEMQDEFVDALERPKRRAEPSGSAALRLRQRYTAAAAAAPRTTA